MRYTYCTVHCWKSDANDANAAKLSVTKFSAISLYVTKLFVKYSFASASSVIYSTVEIRQTFLTVHH